MSDTPRKTGDKKPQRPKRPEVKTRPQGSIVPAANVQGTALMAVIAIMTFLACITLGGVSMVRATAASWQSQISREITIQVRPDDGLDMEATLREALDIALTFTGTTGGRVVDREATARLLEPWLGSGLDIDELPVPRLVIVTIDENDPPDFENMREILRENIPQASLDDHRTWVDRLVSMARTTVAIGTGILILVFSTMVLTVVFATRGALAGNRHIVEVLHFVGAESSFVANEFQKHFLKISLKASLVGAALAALAFAIAGWWQSQSLATPESDQATALFGQFTLGAMGYVGIAITLGLIAALTTLTARLTVMRTIDEIDLIRSNPAKIDTALSQ